MRNMAKANHSENRRFPYSISLVQVDDLKVSATFRNAWDTLMSECCHNHPVWKGSFVQSLLSSKTPEKERFLLALVWSINMVAGSYCFPRYVAALAARSELDAVRHGLLENAWDESGSYGHTTRSHFWLAVRLTQLLGLKDTEIERIKPIPEAQVYTDEHYRQCAVGDFGFAFGMICLIEEFTTPEFTLIFKSFLRSCKTGMGIDPDDFVLKGGAEYFTANIADDERHREDMPRLVAAWLDAKGVEIGNSAELEKALEPVRAGIKHSADLRQKFFDGVYHFVKNGGTIHQLLGTP